ncbi:uracil-DNA glycosylase family protein [uncultured Hymenobacter sp.]|uniref:uracil-DNA glycosylase family protein n=1 Tax=uncultured Hymenobacter sp. TaxID=170016 RepID=UPI0035C9C9B2
MLSFADRLLHFLSTFPAPPTLPDEVQAYNPYQDSTVASLMTQFGQKYYADQRPRVALLGINPGRFGAGRTGVAFTDPATLAGACGIPNELPQHPELSSQFVYRVVAALGGPAAFYQDFYLGSLYPLVLLRHGKNYNYYDSSALTTALEPAIRVSLQRQVDELGLVRTAAVCLGRRNGLLFEKLNKELGLFNEIHVLDHPRYLMQYKCRELPLHVARYAEVLGSVVSS